MAGNTTDGKTRETWPSRTAFYFAAVGAAVGFGNVWRFPALSVEYGGGAFFIPYLMALFLIGIPILILEIGFGKYIHELCGNWYQQKRLFVDRMTVRH
jgi:SNF family Na+-dependent transporter